MAREWDNMDLVPDFDKYGLYYDNFTVAYRWFAVFSLVLKIYYVLRISTLSTLHLNFRITVCNTVISMELMHITLLLGHYYNDITINNQNRYVTNIGCVVIGIVNNIAVIDAAVSMLMLAVERQLAYNWVDIYETKAKTFAFTLIFIMLGVSITVGIVSWYFFLIYLDDFDLNTSRMSCIPIHVNWEYEVAGFALSSNSCLIGAAWFAALRKQTKHGLMNRLSLTSLSARFQATENSHTTASIFPSMATFVVAAWMGLAAGIVRGILAQKYGDHTVYSRFLGDIGFLIVDIYSLCHLLCILCYNPAVKAAFQRDLNRILCWQIPRTPNKLDDINTAEVYFDQLKNAWNK